MQSKHLTIGIMNSKGRKDMFIGLALGLVFPLFGFLVYGLYWSWRFNKTMTYFARDLFLEIPGFTSSILSLCLLANLIPFLFFIRRDRSVLRIHLFYRRLQSALQFQVD